MHQQMDIKHWAALEQVDADSWEEMCRAVPADVAQTLKLSVERHGSVVVTRCLVSDVPLSNRALALGFDTPLTKDYLLRLRDDFKASGLKNFALQISPYAQPANLVDCLDELGLVVRSRWVKLARGCDQLSPVARPIEVRLVSRDEASLFGEVSALGFGRPPIIAHWMASTVGFAKWRHYLAYVDGKPAGAAAIYLDQAYAWLGIGSTLQEFRRRGVQQALIARRLEDAMALGVEHFVAETESHNISCQNLVQAGFSVAYERANYGIPLAE